MIPAYLQSYAFSSAVDYGINTIINEGTMSTFSHGYGRLREIKHDYKIINEGKFILFLLTFQTCCFYIKNINLNQGTNGPVNAQLTISQV